MSVKNDILDNLKAALGAIRPAAGYNTEVVKVSRFATPYDIAKEKTPFIAIVEETETKLAEDAVNCLFRMTLTVTGFIRDTADIEEKITKLTDDIRTVIYVPVQLGTYCLDVVSGEVLLHLSESEKEAGVHVTVEILYYAPKAGF